MIGSDLRRGVRPDASLVAGRNGAQQFGVTLLFWMALLLAPAVNAQVSPPSVAVCNGVQEPDNPPLVPAGHWFNPKRYGQGWDLTYWDQGSGRQLKLTWYTYTADRKPIWFDSDPAPIVNAPGTPNHNTWQGTVFRTRMALQGGVRVPVREVEGSVAIRFTANPKFAAIASERLGFSASSECIIDIFRQSGVAGGDGEPRGAEAGSPELSGVWRPQGANPEADPRAVHVQKAIGANGTDVELIYPLVFDSSPQGQPVWLYGQFPLPNGPGTLPSDYTHTLYYNLATYHPGTDCLSEGCLLRLQTDPPAAFRRILAPGAPPWDPMVAKIDICATAGSSDCPVFDESVEVQRLLAWRVPLQNWTKQNLYSSIQVNQYDCQLFAPATTCPIQVSWAVGSPGGPGVSVCRVAEGGSSIGSEQVNQQSHGSISQLLPAGAIVHYRLVPGAACTAEPLAQTPVIRVYDEFPDQAIVPQPIDPHDPTIGAVAGSAAAGGGAASFAIPIKVPPGRAGMAPSLGLSYSSRAGNGLAGMGWSVSGLSSIHRCPQTVAQDLGNVPVTFDNSDRLCLDGQRLVVMAGGGEYGAVGTQYGTEIESLRRVTQLGNDLAKFSTETYFKVENPDGSLSWYGAVEDSTTEFHGRHPNGTLPPLSWALVRRVDAMGNSVDYHYSIQADSDAVISEIHYTGMNDQRGNRSVVFEYQARPASQTGGNDISSTYLSGRLVLQSRRLAFIRTNAPASQAGGATALIREYRLDYGTHNSQGTGRSLLRSVTECTASPQLHCLPATTFSWQDSLPSYHFGALSSDYALTVRPLTLDARGLEDNGEVLQPTKATIDSVLEQASRVRPIGDLDGDGSRELLVDGPGGYVIARLTADRQVTGVLPVANLGAMIAYFGGHPSSQPSDIDLDGAVELVGSLNGQLAFSFWNGGENGDWKGSSFATLLPATPIPYSPSEAAGASVFAKDLYVQDFNGDGKVDVLLTRKSGSIPASCGAQAPVLLYVNNSASANTRNPSFKAPALVTCLQFSLDIKEELIGRIGDFNGDGLPDIFVEDGAALVVPSQTSNAKYQGFTRLVENQSSASILSWRNRNVGEAGFTSTLAPADFADPGVHLRWMDVNGDGLQDVVVGRSHGWEIHLNSGLSLAAAIPVSNSAGQFDGLGADRCDPIGGSSAPETPGGCARRYSSHVQVVDWDSDGKEDVLVPYGIAAQICMIAPASGGGCEDPRGGCEFRELCAENPVTGASPASSSGLYRFGGSWSSIDPTVYTSAALKFVQTGPASFVLQSIAPGGSIGNSLRTPLLSLPGSGGDFYGDGLGDFLTVPGCWFLGDTCYRVGGPTTLPNGLNIDTLIQQQQRPVLLNENRGACAGGASPGRCQSNSLPPVAGDLLSVATDGMGRSASWDYFPLASSAGRDAGGAALPFYSIPARGTGQGYVDGQHFYFASSMNAVEAFSQSDGVGGFRLTTYSYSEAMYNNQGRGFQGFRGITEDVAVGSAAVMRTSTLFHQKFPLTSQVESMERRLASELPFGSAPPIESTEHIWRSRLSEDGTRKIPYARRTRTTRNDLQTREQVGQTTRYVGNGDMDAQDGIDAFGNITRDSTVTSDSAAFMRQEVVVERQYANDTGAGDWWIGRMIDEKQYSWTLWHPKDYQVGGLSLDPDIVEHFRHTANTYHLPTRKLMSTQVDSQGSSAPGGPVDINFALQEFEYESTHGNLSAQSLSGGWIASTDSRRTLYSYSESGGYFPTRVTAVVVAGEPGSADFSPLNHVTTSVFSPATGQVLSVTDPNGLTTTSVPDGFGRIVETVYPSVGNKSSAPPKRTHWQRCSSGSCPSAMPGAVYRVQQVQDGTPPVTIYFDMLDREVGRETKGLHGGLFPNRTVRTFRSFDARGLLATEAAPHFSTAAQATIPVTTYGAYDALGRLLQKQSPTAQGSRQTNYVHDGLTTLIQVTVASVPGQDHSQLLLSRTHGLDGALLHTEDAAAGEVFYRYDGAGNAIMIADPNGVQTRAVYNGLNQRISVDDPNRGNWTYTYNAAGEVWQEVDGRGRTTVRSFDRLGRMTSECEPGDAQACSNWVFDATKKGLPFRVWRGLGSAAPIAAVSREFHYDELSRPSVERVRIREDAVPAINCHGSTNGLDACFDKLTAYDAYYGWAKQEYRGPPPGINVWESGNGAVTEYWKRDPYGHLIEEGLLRRFYQDSESFGNRVLEMDPYGNPTRQRQGNGLETTSTHNTRTAQLEGRCVGPADMPGPTGCTIFNLTYGHDEWGNLLSQRQDYPGVTVQEQLRYDELHRLVKSTYPGEPGGPTVVDYSYDRTGNIVSKSDYSLASVGGSTPYLYEASRPNAVRQVSKPGGGVDFYDHDGNGNQVARRYNSPTSIPERVVEYDLRNLPIRVDIGDRWKRFRYEPGGHRYLQVFKDPGLLEIALVSPFPGYELEYVISRPSANAVSYGLGEARQYLGTYAIVRSVAGTLPLTAWMHNDRLGSPAAKTRDDQSIFDLAPAGGRPERHGFDPFGKPRRGDNWFTRPLGELNIWTGFAVPLSVVSRRGFTGHEHLHRTDLIHMNGRLFDYNIGRFLSVDPIIQFPANSQSLNPYSYLMNNPLSGTDPSGYVGCGEVAIEGGASGSCTHTLSNGKTVDVDYDVSGDADSVSISGTEAMFGAILADNGARQAQSSAGEGRSNETGLESRAPLAAKQTVLGPSGDSQGSKEPHLMAWSSGPEYTEPELGENRRSVFWSRRIEIDESGDDVFISIQVGIRGANAEALPHITSAISDISKHLNGIYEFDQRLYHLYVDVFPTNSRRNSFSLSYSARVGGGEAVLGGREMWFGRPRAGTFAHEFLHLLGFSHLPNWTAGLRSYAPYRDMTPSEVHNIYELYR